MSGRAKEINGVALSTIDAAIDELAAANFGVAQLPFGPTHLTLDELAERRAAVSGRIGETRTALLGLRDILLRQRETMI